MNHLDAINEACRADLSALLAAPGLITPPPLITEPAFIRLLVSECDQCGGVRAWARRKDVSHSLVSQTINRARDRVSETVANAMGFGVAPTMLMRLCR